MKRILITILFLLILIPFYGVYAHELESENTIGAVLHVDPEDDPIIGQESTFFFEVKDTTGRFKGELCDCTATISRQGKVVHTVKLFAEGSSDLTTPVFSYVFPEKDTYTVSLFGKPKEEGAFDAFTLSYDLRVERVPPAMPKVEEPTTTEYMPYIALGVGAIVFLLIFLARRKRA
jgi:hypothetical protein